jgi:hypothetical protein
MVARALAYETQSNEHTEPSGEFVDIKNFHKKAVAILMPLPSKLYFEHDAKLRAAL